MRKKAKAEEQAANKNEKESGKKKGKGSRKGKGKGSQLDNLIHEETEAGGVEPAAAGGEATHTTTGSYALMFEQVEHMVSLI